LTLSLVAAAMLSGCGAFYSRSALLPQETVNQRLLGTPVADFFARHGRPGARIEAADGSVAFDWHGGLKSVQAGPYGSEESICWLRITADRSGRIVAAPIFRDGQGERGISRCVELLGPAEAPTSAARLRPLPSSPGRKPIAGVLSSSAFGSRAAVGTCRGTRSDLQNERPGRR
jgi:hypothetical protein